MSEVTDPSLGHRARLRAQTTEQILDAARRRLDTDGAAGVTLRAIARDLGTGVSSLYRYFGSRDELITALLVEAYNSQADAVAEAISEHGDPAEALYAGLRAYREWSLANPSQFALAYGTPVPGYVAPGDRTIGPGTRVGGQIIALLTVLWRQDRLQASVLRQRDELLCAAERRDLQALADRRGYEIPCALLSLFVDLFVRLHGFVVMEVFGQLRPITQDPADVFDRTVSQAVGQLGLCQ
jgi:AcrR family transcriptional regulator